MSPSLGMHSGGRQRRVSENMVLGGMNKLGGSGGHLMNMGNVLQTSNRHNTFAGKPKALIRLCVLTIHMNFILLGSQHSRQSPLLRPTLRPPPAHRITTWVHN